MMTHAPVSKGIETHPYLVNSLNELPPSLRQSVQQTLEPTEQPLRIFVVPAQSYLQKWFTPRIIPQQVLIFTAQGVLHVQEAISPDQPAQATYVQAVNLLYVQLYLLLLYGRLELVGHVNDSLVQIVVEFNVAGIWLLLPGVRQLLRLACGQTEINVPPETPPKITLPEFQKLPFKFKNGLRIYGLQPDECLQGVIFQPGIWERGRSLFQRQVTVNILLALTDREVIVVEESQTTDKNPYGWILTYYPLTHVKGIETASGKILQIHLTHADVSINRQITLETEAMLAWQDLWAHRSVSIN